MNKFLAIVKREYVQRVRTKLFIVMTILGPVLLAVFTIVPGLLFSIKTGGATRIAIVDQTEGAKLYGPLRTALLREDRGNERQLDVPETMNSNSKERFERTGKSLTGKVCCRRLVAFLVAFLGPRGESRGFCPLRISKLLICKRPRRVLVLHLCGRAQCATLRRVAQEADAWSQASPASGARRPAGA